MNENGVYTGTYAHPNSNYPSKPTAQEYIRPGNERQSNLYPVAIAQAFPYDPSSANGSIQNNGPCAISPPVIWEIIENSHSYAVRQHINNLPERCLTSCFSCSTREENAYSIFAGSSNVTQTEILRVDEVEYVDTSHLY
jgi:hypothetical protein